MLAQSVNHVTLDRLTARHKLLLCCFLLAICPPFLYCKLFCRQDGGIVPPFFIPHQPFQNRTIPRKLPAPLPYERSVGFAVLLPSTITLASPRKRGGGTADIIFWLAVQYSDSPAFTILKLFRAVTVGIVNASEAFMLALLSISIPFDPHQPFPNRTIPRSAPHSCLTCQR